MKRKIRKIIKMNIIDRLNRLPKKYHKGIFNSFNNKNFETYVKKTPLMMEFDNYQLHFTYDDYIILKEYIREIKLKRTLND